MNKLLNRFYYMYYLSYALTTILIYNEMNIKTTPFHFYSGFIILLVSTFILLFFEHKIGKKSFIFSLFHVLICLLLPVMILIDLDLLSKIIILSGISVILLAKFIYAYKFNGVKMDINNLNLIPKLLASNYLIVFGINLLFKHLFYLTIFYLLFNLVIELILYIKIRPYKNGYEMNLIMSIIAISLVFALTYIGDLDTINRYSFNIILNLIVPVQAIIVAIYSIYLNKKKVDELMKVITV